MNYCCFVFSDMRLVEIQSEVCNINMARQTLIFRGLNTLFLHDSYEWAIVVEVAITFVHLISPQKSHDCTHTHPYLSSGITLSVVWILIVIMRRKDNWRICLQVVRKDNEQSLSVSCNHSVLLRID